MSYEKPASTLHFGTQILVPEMPGKPLIGLADQRVAWSGGGVANYDPARLYEGHVSVSKKTILRGGNMETCN